MFTWKALHIRTSFNTSDAAAFLQQTRNRRPETSVIKPTSTNGPFRQGAGGLPTHAKAGRRATQEDLVWNICTGVTGVVFVVDDEQNHTQEEADGAHGHVGDAREGVLPSHPGDGAEDHPLATVEAEHGVI